MEQVMFSIVVVCLNAGDKLLQTVESIRSQTCENYEIIVKDGVSSDGSTGRLPGDDRIRLVVKKDTGIYDAMNQAIREVQGAYVYFLNCGDVFFDENVLARAEEQMRAVRGNGGLKERDSHTGEGPERYIFYGDIRERKTGERVASNPALDAFGCYRNVPCHQACFYAAELMKEKGFEPKYKVRADYEHFLWCFFKGDAEMVYLPFVVADYEGGGFSETKENRKRSAAEHKEITGIYMQKGQLIKYRTIMLLTLAPLRTWIAGNKATARLYNRLKKKLYGQRNAEEKE